MLGSTWLQYFEGNARDDRAPDPALSAEVAPELRLPLAASLARFQLGESAGGRIHEEITTLPDRTLDPGMRRAVQLYIEEEWRHSRELAHLVRGLGGKLLAAHWTNGAFTACPGVELGDDWDLYAVGAETFVYADGTTDPTHYAWKKVELP